MAAEPARKQPPAAASGAPASKAKRRKLPWIVLFVALLGVGSGAAWWFMKPAAAAAATGSAAPAPPRAAPIYYKFDPAFVVNFGGPGSARYFQVTVEAMARDQQILDVLKNNDPAVRNDLILLYSSQDAATLMSTEGKEKLRAATLAAIRKVLSEAGADGNRLEQVYFTSFVIQ
jgi:flagellar FliL protein